jgi:calcineurin-like phosphoesterase family protein
MKYFISDTHFGHERIIQLCDRPFKNKDEMDQVMIQNWNSIINVDDEVYHLGDFMFYKKDTGIFNQLKGKKFLIKGNHDHSQTYTLPWEGVKEYAELIVNDKKLVLFHYPIFSWNAKFHGSYHFHGHTHNIPEEQLKEKNRFNISVEYMKYRPKTFEQIVGE